MPRCPRSGDYADLYFEYITASSLMVDASLVEIRQPGNQRRLRLAGGLGRTHRVCVYRRFIAGTAFARRAYGGTDLPAGHRNSRCRVFAETPSAGLVYTVSCAGNGFQETFGEAGADSARLIAQRGRTIRASCRCRRVFADELRRILVAGVRWKFRRPIRSHWLG